jgi:hypothetical protein
MHLLREFVLCDFAGVLYSSESCTFASLVSYTFCLVVNSELIVAAPAFPTIFGINHGFNTQSVGLSFIGIGIGMIFALASQPFWNRWVYSLSPPLRMC